MGNQLLKGYTIQGEPVSAIGCQKMWRIYQGHKTNTNVMCTIFAIEKKALAKAERQQLIQFAKRQAMGLARIRHPGVLAITETLIEDQAVMAFSTEQIQGNLTILARENKLKQIISNEIQMRLNLFPLLDTIQFLHQNVKTVHLGLNFDNIYITKEGKWKLSGFSNSQIHSGQGLEDLKNFRCSNYYFCPPEVVNQKKFEKKSDIYSFGMLILDLLLVLVGKYEPKNYRSQAEYQQNFQKDLLAKINNQSLQKIDNYKQLKLLFKNVFARQPEKRLSLQQLSSSKWLNDKLVLTVRYLQNITNYDSKQQVQFLKGLMGIVNHFQPRILMRKVMPLLLDLLKFKHLIPSVIYICLEMMKNGKIISDSDFRQKVWPSLKKVVQGKEMTAHSLYLFVQNMEKIQKVIGMQQLSQCVVPLYVKCFDCPAKLKQLALHKTDYVLSKMDYQFVKTKMIPKVINCIKDQNPQIHKKSLIALRKSIKILDTQTITSIVLPGLQNCRKSGSDPFVNAITVSIYQMLGRTLPSEILCAKLLPTIMPYLSDPNVGPQDFYNYKKALMTMIDKIQSERKKFWDESQITQGRGYTEKDFEFEQDTKKNAQSQSSIGKGDYNFLSNYNNNQKAGEQELNRNESTMGMQKKDSNNAQFNFSSPFSMDNTRQPQAQPTSNQYQNYGGDNRTGNNQYDNQFNSPMRQQYQNSYSNQNQNQSQNYGQNRIQANTNNNSMGGLGSFDFGSDLSSGDGGRTNNNYMNSNKNEGINQPISPETKQSFPKLKGPESVPINRIRKPEPALDPWASISLQDAPQMGSYSQNNDYGMGGYNSSNTNTNNNLNFNNQTATSTSYNLPNSGTNIGLGGGYGLGGTYLGSVGDDPFADIQQKSIGNTSLNTGMHMNMGSNSNVNMNMNMNMGMGMGTGTGMGLGMGSNTNKNSDFSLGFGDIGGTQQNNVFNYGMSNIGGASMDFGLTQTQNKSNFGNNNPSNLSNNDPFSFGIGGGINQQSSPKKQNTSSDFDLI